MGLFSNILRSVDSSLDDVSEAAVKAMRKSGRFLPSPEGYIPKKGDWNLEGLLRKATDVEEATYGTSLYNNAYEDVANEQFSQLLSDYGVSSSKSIPADLKPDFDQEWSMALQGGVLEDLANQRAAERLADIELDYKNTMSPVRKRVEELPEKHPFRNYLEDHIDYGNSLETDDDVLALVEDLHSLAREGVARKDITQVFGALTKNGTRELDQNIYRYAQDGLARIPASERLNALSDLSDNWDNVKEYVSNLVADRPELRNSIPGLTREVVDNVMDIYRTLRPEQRGEYFKQLANWYDDLDSVVFMLENV